MELQQLLTILRELAPESLAEPWDRVGLQLDAGDRPVRRALLCIDLTEPVLEEAIEAGVQLVVAYHPPIFKPLESLRRTEAKERLILNAAQAGIAIYTPHTALDAAPGGIAEWLAASLGSGRVRTIRPASPGRQYKLVVFVPGSHAEALRRALSDAGAGVIGHYSQCSFTSPGQGTFKGDETTNPAVGSAGELERVDELRIEMVLPGSRVDEAVAALWKHHPYEEPAYDIYPLHTPPVKDGPGQGRVVELARPVALSELADRVKQRLSVDRLAVAAAPDADPVHRVGLVPGAGGSLLSEAGPLDVFITGEMRHHEVLAARAAGTTVLLAGHTQTERPYLPTYRQRLIDAGAGAVEWLLSSADTPPEETW